MFGKLWRILKPFHRTFITLVIMAIFYEGARMLESYMVSFIVRMFEMKIQVGVWLIIAVGFLGFNEAYMRFDNRWDWHVITKQSHPIYRYLKLAAIAKFLKMDVIWHQHHNSGSLVGKVSDGVWKTMSIVDMISWEFMPTTVQMVVSMIPLILMSPFAAILCALAFVLFIVITLRGEKRKAMIRSKRHDIYEEEWSQSVQSVQGHETVVMFGQQQRLLSTQEDLHDRIIEKAHEEHRLGVFRYNRWRIRILTTIRTLIYVIWVIQLMQGTIDIPNLIFVSVLTERLLGSFWRFARLADQVYSNSEGVMRLLNLLDEQEPIERGKLSVAVSESAEIVFNDVCFAYTKDYSEDDGALHGFNLTIPAGKTIALVGPSGAGKTTVRKIVTKLIPIQKGQISVAGMNIDDWDSDKLRALFSYVPQGDDVYIWDDNVRYNIAFPRPEASEAEIMMAAKLAGIHDFITTLEKGYETLVGERGIRLSGGQKQRIALARAILANRPILILDEATSAVDAITEDEIQTNMKQILSGKTAIIIAHRLSTIWDADKIVVMDQGRIVEEGTHAELVSLGGLYAKMVTLQTNK